MAFDAGDLLILCLVQVRLTSIHQLEGLEGEISNGVFIGKEGKSFEFKDLSHSVTYI